MDRIARFDFSRRFERPATQYGVQVAIGVGCVVGMILVRGALDLVALSSGPFALIYPTIVLATLYGHWRGGLTAYLMAFLWSWYVILPERWSFDFANPADMSRTAINAVTALVVLVVPEGFRLAAQRYREQSERALARRLVLLAELEHRTKNNFALVASLLEIQKRRVVAPEASVALEDAIGRVHAFATAYSNLALEQQEGAEVDMKPYLEQLLGRVASASFHDGVRLVSSIDAMQLPREVGIAIGLYLNEALANCAKYAFTDGRHGTVSVRFVSLSNGWRLEVEDDGTANAKETADASDPQGLGTSLMAAFAAQARAQHTVESFEGGFRVALESTSL